MQSRLPSLNDILLAGGLIAGAYIIYRASKLGSSVSDTLGEAKDKVTELYSGISDTVKTAFTPNDGPDVYKTVKFPIAETIHIKGLSDPVSFSALGKSDPYDVTSPMYTSGKVYADGYSVVPLGQFIGGTK